MSKRYVLSKYVELAMSQAVYDKLEDASFSGRIPACPGVRSRRHSRNVKRNCAGLWKIGYSSGSNCATICRSSGTLI